MAGVTFDDLIPSQTAAPAGKTFDPAAGITIRFPGQAQSDQSAAAEAAQPVQSGGNVVTFDDLVPKREPTSPVADFFKSIPGGALSGFTGALSNIGKAGAIDAQMSGVQTASPDTMPTGEQGVQQVESVVGPLHQPEGPAGKFGQTIGQFIGNPASYIGPGSLPAKIGMAALAGIGDETGGQLAAGTPYEGIARFGGAALGAGAAAKAFQPGQVNAVIGPKPSSAAPSIADLDTAATGVYENPGVKSLTVPAPEVESLATQLTDQLTRKGFRPTDTSAKGTFSELGNLNPVKQPSLSFWDRVQAEMNGEPIPAATGPSNVSVDDLRSARMAFSRIAQETRDGRPTPDAKAASRVLQEIDGLLNTAAPKLKEANANYSAARTAESVDKKAANAEIDAAAANSGLNVENKIRQAAAKMLKNPAHRRGMKDDEVQLLKRIVFGSKTQNAMRFIGNLLGGNGGWATAIMGLASAGIAPAVGITLKHIGNYLTIRQAEQLSQMIRARSPLGQAITNAATDWNKARDALVSGPSSAKFAAFSLASRNLSNNLASVGVNIHPTQLLRSVQGPVDANADQEKQ